MSLIYHRYVNGVHVRFGKYSDYEYAIYIGNRLYATIDNLVDANREYQQINESTVAYLGLA